jgi:hypothetical protein
VPFGHIQSGFHARELRRLGVRLRPTGTLQVRTQGAVLQGASAALLGATHAASPMTQARRGAQVTPQTSPQYRISRHSGELSSCTELRLSVCQTGNLNSAAVRQPEMGPNGHRSRTKTWVARVFVGNEAHGSHIALSAVHKRAAASGAGSTLAVREGACTLRCPMDQVRTVRVVRDPQKRAV